MDDLIDIEEGNTPQGPEPISITDKAVSVDPKFAQRRAKDTHNALGKESPGLEALYVATQNGTEEAIRNSAAVNESIRRQNMKAEAIRKLASETGQAVTPDVIARLDALINMPQGVAPEVVVEKKIADKVIDSVEAASGEEGTIRKARDSDPEGTAQLTEVASDGIARGKIAQKIAEEAAQKAKEQSWLGWGVDLLESAIPGRDVYLRNKAFPESTAGIEVLAGKTLEENLKYLHTLPPEQFERQSRMAFEYLAERNIFEAQRFAEALNGYSNSDAAWDNAFSIANFAGAPPGWASAKGLAKGILNRRAGAAGVGTTAAEKALSQSKLVEVLKRVGKSALGNDTVDEAKALMEAGHIADGAMSTARRIIEEGADTRTVGKLPASVPSLFNPASIAEGASTLGREAVERLVVELKGQATRTLETLTDAMRVERGTEAAIAVGEREAMERIRDDYRHINHAILDVKIETRVDPLANTYETSAYIGRTDGTLFDSAKQAVRTAIDHYGMLKNDIQAVEIGDGYWALKVTRVHDETTDAYRKALSTDPSNTTPVGRGWGPMGWLRSAEDLISNFQSQQRHVAQHGMQRLIAMSQEIAEEIGKLSNESKTALKKVLEANKSHVEMDEKTSKLVLGRFNNTVSEFENEFQQLNGILPTAAETKAYFSYIQLNDMDFLVRNFTMYRDKVRQGMQNFNLGVFGKFGAGGEVKFEGKVVKELPRNIKADAGVYLHLPTDAANPGTYRRLNAFEAEDWKTVEDITKGGYRIIQVANPTQKPLASALGDDRVINFIITRYTETEALPYQQIPYRPGGHKEYVTPHFVKQPVISRRKEGDVTSHHYEGETAVFGFNTEAEARKYAERMNTARLLLKEGKTSELNGYLKENLPYTYAEFKALFDHTPINMFKGQKPTYGKSFLNIDDPIVYLPDGKRFTDDYPDMAKGYENFQDDIRSPYNLYDNIDKEYAGQRNPDLYTVREGKGSDNDPLYRVDKAEQLDPFATMTRAMANVMRNRFMDDYKIQAVESFVSEFGDLIKGNRHLDEIKTNPEWFVHNPSWDQSTTDKLRLADAKAAHRALVNFLGTMSPLKQEMDTKLQKVANSIYDNFGQKASDKVSGLAMEGDPFRYGRKVAFHLTLGLFNPVQFLLQAQTMTHILGVAGPKVGIQGIAAGTMMNMLRFTQNENVIKGFAKKAAAFGWKTDDFVEAYTTLKRTGWDKVAGETAWHDDALEPKMFNGMWSKFVDKGTVFFKEGEKQSRLTAWATAFREWRLNNPGAAVDNKALAQILQRADTLSVNMTRASNAAWNQGIMSIPTQFLSYQARLMEQFMGKRLTREEKLRAFATYSVMYGIPGGLGAAAGILPWYEDIRKEALERGYDTSDPVVMAMHNGMVQTMWTFITGQELNFSQRMGPTGTSLFKDIWKGEKTGIEIFLGPSGSILSNTLAGMEPVLWGLTSPFRPDDQKYTPTFNDVMQALQGISSVNNAVKATVAYNTGLWTTKTGTVLKGDVSGFDAFMMGITGASPTNVADAFLMTKSLKDQKTFQDSIQKKVNQAYSRALKAYVDNDPTTGDSYMAQVRMWVAAGGWRPDQMSEVFSQARRGNENMIERIEKNFVTKAPEGQAAPRLEQLLKNRQ